MILLACTGHCLHCGVFWFFFVPMIYLVCIIPVVIYYQECKDDIEKSRLKSILFRIGAIFAPLLVLYLICKGLYYLLMVFVRWLFKCDTRY